MNFHGIKVNEINGGIRPLASIASAIIGIIATAIPDQTGDVAAIAAAQAKLDADFPLNTPVLVTDIRSAVANSGAGGTLRPSLQAIADITNPIMVVVRVAEGADIAETNTNVIGDFTDAGYTGMKALLAAESQLGVRPRILIAPALDSQEVTVDLVAIAQQLNAFTYAKNNAVNVESAILYRGQFGQRELMLIWPNWKSDFAGDAIARAAGLRALIDEQTGWHKTLSNIAVPGVIGLSNDVSFNLQDNQTDAGLLNGANVTTLIRQNGYRYWGNRTCSDEPLFQFESAVRTAQILKDTIANGIMWAIDKPINGGLIDDIIATINAEFARLIAAGRLVGGEAWFDKEANPADGLAAGRITIDYDFTPLAPAEAVTLNQRITDRYYADLNLAA